jgi:hypothetical protein
LYWFAVSFDRPYDLVNLWCDVLCDVGKSYYFAAITSKTRAPGKETPDAHSVIFDGEEKGRRRRFSPAAGKAEAVLQLFLRRFSQFNHTTDAI